MRRISELFLILGFVIVATTQASATCNEADKRLQQGDTVVDEARYNEFNDTWYELAAVCTNGPNRMTWREAFEAAYRMTYKGRRGRLAIVNSPQIHEFLGQFKPKGITWIGLRYWCQYKRMKWVDGSTHEVNDFSVWSTPWNAGATHRWGTKGAPPQPLKCSLDYWPVHYWPYSQGFQWNANGFAKHGTLFFVEYPPEKIN